MDIPRNPHVAPQVASGRYSSTIRERVSLRCTPESPAHEYVFHKDDVVSVVHWGQRKLLLTEINFLTLYGGLSNTVVYAGAAPGTHLAQLLELFPTHTFHLYDPAPFNVTADARVHVYRQMFTDDDARAWACTGEPISTGESVSTDESVRGSPTPTPVLFVSDVRSADLELMGSDETHERVRADMEDQKRWTQLMQPAMASLKFRLPWDEGQTSYLAGELYFQVWAPGKSTETRLFTNGQAETLYDHKLYEGQCFYHNTVARLARYPHGVRGVEGLDHCGDCTGEIQILRDYLWATGGDTSDKAVGRLMARISRSMRGGRSLATVVDKHDVRRRTRAQQWVDGRPAYQYSDAAPKPSTD